MKRFVSFTKPDISEEEIREVEEVLSSGWITTGPKTKEFEEKIAEFCLTEKAVCLSSATAAEEMILRICGIGPGDEVIVPAYTYTATASAVIHVGAKPVFVDSGIDTPFMDILKLEKVISKATKAIVAVDFAGIIANYENIFSVVENKRQLFTPKNDESLGSRIQNAFGRIIVIADAAHSFGSLQNNICSGNIADFTSFSFHATKNLTTAEGGACTWRSIPGISNEEIYKTIKVMSLHGQSKDAFSKFNSSSWEYDVEEPWFKSNMTDIAAAIGVAQLRRYKGMQQRRYEIIRKYDEAFDKTGISHLNHFTEKNQSNGHLYPIRILGVDDQRRRTIIDRLVSMGVSVNVHFKPLPMMKAYIKEGWDIKDFPNAYAYYENLITLPMHTKMSDEDVDYVIETVIKVVSTEK